jgi:hypothetical protein
MRDVGHLRRSQPRCNEPARRGRLYSEAVAAIKLKAQEHANNLRSILEDIRARGTTSVRKIAEELNHRGILAPRGGEWHATSVVRLLSRTSR